MPKAAQATRTPQARATVKKVHPTVLIITLDEAGLLPKEKKPLTIWPMDDPKKVLPSDQKHGALRSLIGKIKPGSGKIDYLIIMPGKKSTMIRVQLQDEYDSGGVSKRIDSAITAAHYSLEVGI